MRSLKSGTRIFLGEKTAFYGYIVYSRVIEMNNKIFLLYLGQSAEFSENCGIKRNSFFMYNSPDNVYSDDLTTPKRTK